MLLVYRRVLRWDAAIRKDFPLQRWEMNFFFFMKFPSSETVSVSPMSKLVSGRRKGCQELYSIISLLSKSLKAARGGGEGGLEDQSVRIPLSKL